MAGAVALSNGLEAKMDVRGAVRTAKSTAIFKKRTAKSRPGLTLPAEAVAFTWTGAEHCLRTLAHLCGTQRGVKQQEEATAWLQSRVLNCLSDMWVPRRTKEWVPGKLPQAPRTELDSSDDEEDNGDGTDGHTIWRKVPPTEAELGYWRFFMKYPRAAGKNDWMHMAIEASRMAAVAKRIARAHSRKLTVKWAAQILEGAAAKAHGFVKDHPTVLDLLDVPLTAEEASKIATELQPDEATRRTVLPWHRLWARDAGQLKDLAARQKTLRAACLREDSRDELDLAATKAGIKRFNAGAVPGVDAISVRELAALPDVGLSALTDVLNGINAAVAWPPQVLHHQVVLLPKPRGGERPICLVAMLIKLWEATHAGTVLSWEQARVGFWDDAIRGSSALRAAALRRLTAEVAHLNHESFLYILWDAEKFYDNVDLSILLEAALKLGLPRREMVLCLDVLLAPREVRVGKISSPPVAPANGMLAGLKRANFFARLLLYGTLDTLHRAIPKAGPRSYVDDLTQLITGDREDVVANAVTGAWMLHLALQQLKVKVSTKSVIVGSNAGLAREVADKIRGRCGLALANSDHAADLGVDCGGSRRCLRKTEEREEKADCKLSRIQYLGSLNKTADKLVGSGADPPKSLRARGLWHCPCQAVQVAHAQRGGPALPEVRVPDLRACFKNHGCRPSGQGQTGPDLPLVRAAGQGPRDRYR